MATIDDAIYEVVRGSGTAEEKSKLIHELITAMPTDRWTFRWVIWGLLVIVITTIVIVLLAWLFAGKDVAQIPQGVIAIASTSVGALAAFITPGSHSQSVNAPGAVVPADRNKATT